MNHKSIPPVALPCHCARCEKPLPTQDAKSVYRVGCDRYCRECFYGLSVKEIERMVKKEVAR